MQWARVDEPIGPAPGFDDFELKLGDVMRGERATLGKSLLDVQRELRIRASSIAAIENCDVSAFETPSFVAGYVRSYARYLGMDPDATFRRFCEESGFQPTHGMAPAAAGPKPQRRPSDPVEALASSRALFIPQPESLLSRLEPRALGSLAILLLLVAGLGYGGYSVLQEVQKVRLTPVDEAPGVVTALDPVAEGAAAGGEDQAVAEADLPRPEALDRLYRPQALEVPVVTARDTPIAAIDPGLPTAAPAAPGGVEAAVAEALAAAVTETEVAGIGPQLPDAAQTVRTVAPDAPPVEILAARPAWVRVTSADGTVILEKTMDAGERFVLPTLETAPLLRTGNSGAVYFSVNGRTYGPAAPGPQVVKNVELSPDALTAAFAAADLSQDPELAEMVALAAAAPVEDAASAD